MTAVLPTSVILSAQGPSFMSTGQGTCDYLRSPSTDDIYDLAQRVHTTTDTLSRLLLSKTRRRRGPSSEHRKQVKVSVDQFCTFCDDAVALLGTFSYFAHRIARIFESVVDQESYASIEENTSDLQSEMEGIYPQIDSVKARYTSFTSQARDLIEAAPDHQVFRRLDGFWRVVDSQLSSVIERRSVPPSPNASNNARNQWLEYQGCLLGGMTALKQCSDALRVGGDVLKPYNDGREISLSGYMMRGFAAFWSRLTQHLLTLSSRAR